jgi:hypothetical protein
LILVLVVVAFAVLQSVFGVGLLVFGTPTLLLAGFTFAETLGYLLPCSLVISVLQVVVGGRLDSLRRGFSSTAPLFRRCTDPHNRLGFDIRHWLAMLLISGAIRLLGPAGAVNGLIRRHLSLSGLRRGPWHIEPGWRGAHVDCRIDLRRQRGHPSTDRTCYG